MSRHAWQKRFRTVAALHLFPNEDHDAFLHHASAYYDQFQPANSFEAEFIDQMLSAAWQRQRARHLDTYFWHSLFQPPAASDDALTYAARFRSTLLPVHIQFQRAQSQHSRDFHRSLLSWLRYRRSTASSADASQSGTSRPA
ncbi:MAG: hypothetical protein NW208_17075 [Bryobacter sp.]|nr:hypothetical protein [Bryobacter sp.]